MPQSVKSKNRFCFFLISKILLKHEPELDYFFFFFLVGGGERNWLKLCQNIWVPYAVYEFDRGIFTALSLKRIISFAVSPRAQHYSLRLYAVDFGEKKEESFHFTVFHSIFIFFLKTHKRTWNMLGCLER
jgi:hypothetical protein